ISRLLKCLLDFYDFVSFNSVTFLDIIVILNGDTAFYPALHFTHIILKSFQGIDRSNLTFFRWINHNSITDHPHKVVTVYGPFLDDTTRYSSHFGYLEGTSYFKLSGYF